MQQYLIRIFVLKIQFFQTIIMNTSENNNSKIIIIILSLLLLALSVFTYTSLHKKEVKIDSLSEEKLKLQENLNTKIAELDKAMTQNNEFDSQLIEAKEKLVSLRDSIMRLKSIDKNALNRLNLKIATLEKSNRKLLQDVDSLKLVNKNLNIEIDSAKSNIEKQTEIITNKTQENDVLNQKNNHLNETLTKGAALKISDIKAIAMKEKSSGKLRETDVASRTEAFRTSFIIRENAIAQTGNKKAHIVIQNTQGKVIAPVGTFYDQNGTQTEYTDTTDIEYDNKDIEVITITELPAKNLVKGDYFIKIYLENKHLGTSKITLK